MATITTAFDKVGNLTSEAQVIPGQAGLAANSTLTFTNDPLRRVTGYAVNGGAATTYTYDANSNRLSAGTTTFTYNTADQLLTQTKAGVTRNFSYDAAGNQTSSPVSPTTNSTFTYDAVNKPLTVTVPGQSTVTYAYDALGRRRTRTAGGSTETYSYVGDLIARIDRGGGNITDSAIDAMGDRLTVGGAWTIPNVRGDVAGLLNAAQTAVSDAYRYDPYGVNLDIQGSTTNPYRFQGRLLESTSGQYDFGARQYDPAIGAFTSLDTVMGAAQNPLTLNRYLYVHANPEVMIDPDGHRAEQFDSRAERDRAIRSAQAAVAAARKDLAIAAAAYTQAIQAANAARTGLNDACPMKPCPLDVFKEWKQSKLDALAVAISARSAAKANYDRASQAVRDAERALKSAQAVGMKKPDKGPSGPSKGRPSNGRGGPITSSGDDALGRFAGSFAQTVWNGTVGFAWDYATGEYQRRSMVQGAMIGETIRTEGVGKLGEYLAIGRQLRRLDARRLGHDCGHRGCRGRRRKGGPTLRRGTETRRGGLGSPRNRDRRGHGGECNSDCCPPRS
jgi:RHS repeat-associated protein